MPGYDYRPFPYVTPPELSGGAPSSAQVAIVGAGPIGLAAAIDLALHGIKSVVVDDNNVVSVGSRAICWAKRTLEIFDRLGIGDRMLDKGVTWKIGRLFHGEREVYNFDLLPEEGHKCPAFINLQQYYVEQYLVERCADFPDLIDLRWKNAVTGIQQDATSATLSIETPDGAYDLEADYVIACDGANSTVRRLMGLTLEGHAFEERFLIADVRMTAEFPSERWFWFQPTFHPGQTALLHKQPDNIYRIDLQLGPKADPDAEKAHDNVIPRLKKALGGRPFELDWVSVYSFRCARMAKFVHDRVIFAGDSAHVVSPFGARGGNGGIHDVDNLCWKLAAILTGKAGNHLLDSYDEERLHGADENIAHSARATQFMSPLTEAATALRDATLDLASDHDFARKLINSGRLSKPCSLEGLSLQTPLNGEKPPQTPGLACPDLPLDDGWLLNALDGNFTLLASAGVEVSGDLPVVRLPDHEMARQRFGEGVYLIRPDQHICAWWPEASSGQVQQAMARALGDVL